MNTELPEIFTDEANLALRQKFIDTITRRIREIRKEKNMTQEQLAVKAGLHEAYLGHIEVGKYSPTAFVLWKIAGALDTTLDELVKE